jgi:hypothetical protein
LAAKMSTRSCIVAVMNVECFQSNNFPNKVKPDILGDMPK